MNAVVARVRRDEGITLIELLMTIVIMGIIIGAIATALFVGFSTTGETNKRFAESHDAQIASATLAKDVQNAISIADTSVTSGVCSTGALIAFKFDGGSQVRYYYGSGSAGETQVTRRTCDGSDTLVLAHFAAVAGAPTVKCDGVACSPSRPKPDVVKIVVTEQSGYNYTLLGARRHWACASGSDCASPTPAKISFLGLGRLTGTGLKVSGGSSVEAHAGFYVNGAAGSTAVDLSGCNKVPAGSGQPGFCLKVDPTFKIRSGATCVGCNGCPTSNVSPCPDFPTGGFPDPLGSVPVPDETGLPRHPGPAYAGPGVYTGVLDINTGMTTILAPGIYILEKGFKFEKNGSSGNPSTITGSGVLLYNGCGQNAPPGCASTGTVNIQSGTKVDLSPMNCGTYQGILIFQDRLNQQTVTIGGAATLASFTGTIYAAMAGVDWSGHANFIVDSVISGGSMTVSGTVKQGVDNTSHVNISPSNQTPQPC